MTGIDIRLAIAFVLFLLGGWGGYTLSDYHHERLEALQQVAQDKALRESDQKVIAAQSAQHAAENHAAEETQKREQTDSATRDTVVGGLHDLETAVRARLLPAAVGHPGAVQGSQPGTGGDSRLPELLARFDASFDRLIGACQHEYEDRSAILSLEPTVNP